MAERQLFEVEWTGVDYGVTEYIQSYLVEHPFHYYMPPSQRLLYFLTRDHGLLEIRRDFRFMSHEEIEDYIADVLECLE